MPRSRSRSRSKGPRSRSRDRRRSPPRGRKSRSTSRGRKRSPPRRYAPTRRSRSPQGPKDLRERIRRSPSKNRLNASPDWKRTKSSDDRGRSSHRSRRSPDRGHRPSTHSRRSPDKGRRDDRYSPGPSRRKSYNKRSRSPIEKKSKKDESLSIPQKELGYTGRSLNERFASKYDPQHFIPNDNISVGIERNIKGKEPAKVDVPLKASEVIMPRNKHAEYTSTPLTDREEFEEREREEEVEETRVIKVTSSGSLANKKLIDRLDNQYGRDPALDRGDDRDIRRRLGGPNDLRYNLARKRSMRDEDFDDNSQDRGDRRRIDTGRLSGRLGSKSEDANELPDFSQRPGRFEPWVDDPKFIPKGENYFEHDTRDDPNFDSRGNRRIRGRGMGFRGGFRGNFRGGFDDYRGRGGFRGGFRGSFRGRGGFMSEADRPWKHDMFGKEDDEKKEENTATKDKDNSDKRSREHSRSRGGDDKDKSRDRNRDRRDRSRDHERRDRSRRSRDKSSRDRKDKTDMQKGNEKSKTSAISSNANEISSTT